ncbi:MAG: hypothetical protein AMK73_06280, partial [Planctomycetes bacterium SM23_32]
MTRRAARPDAAPGEERIALFNAHAEPFDGYLEHELCLLGLGARRFRLLDEGGRTVPCQPVEPTAKVDFMTRLLFRASLHPRERRLLRAAEAPD